MDKCKSWPDDSYIWKVKDSPKWLPITWVPLLCCIMSCHCYVVLHLSSWFSIVMLHVILSCCIVSCHLTLSTLLCHDVVGYHVLSQPSLLPVQVFSESTQSWSLLHANTSCSKLLMKCLGAAHYFSLGRGVMADVFVWNKTQIPTVMDRQLVPVAVN